MNDENNNDTQTLLDAGKALGARAIEAPTNTAPAILRPEGYVVDYLKPKTPDPLNDFIAARTQLDDADSFIAYVKLFQNHTTLLSAQQNVNLASMEGASICANFDYHEGGPDGAPKRNAHVAIYNLPRSAEMKAWLFINEQAITQDKLARFLDDHLADIRSPESAAILELSEGLEATKSGSASSRIDRVKGGSRLYFEELVDAKTSASQLEIPKLLTLNIPVFEGGAAVDIRARLGIEISGGKVAVTIQLLELHKIMRAALASVKADITAGTGLPIYAGALG